MIPIQDIFMKSVGNRSFRAFIEMPAENVYKWRMSVYDPKTNFSGGHSPKTIHDSSAGAFEEMVDFVYNYLTHRKDGDKIEYIDNPCNCELSKEIEQQAIVSSKGLSIPVKVNGKES